MNKSFGFETIFLDVFKQDLLLKGDPTLTPKDHGLFHQKTLKTTISIAKRKNINFFLFCTSNLESCTTLVWKVVKEISKTLTTCIDCKMFAFKMKKTISFCNLYDWIIRLSIFLT